MQAHVRNIYRSKTNYSREIARIFKVADYIFFIPALLGLLISLLSIIYGFIYLPLLIYGIVSSSIITFGLILFGGYIAHCNQNLKQNMVFWLWIGTIIYNGVPLIFTVNKVIPFIFEEQNYSPDSDIPLVFIFLICLCLYWLAAFILAIVALSWTIKASKYEF